MPPEVSLMRDLYGNTKASGFTISYFHSVAGAGKRALLASPFFSDCEPIRLLTNRHAEVWLLIRLCSHTSPDALHEAMGIQGVRIRYYTARSFHLKCYIVGDQALVGSANLTSAGMMSNREVSILVQRGRDAAFEELPGLFDELWNGADVLNASILLQFNNAFRSSNRPADEDQFDQFLKNFIKPVAPQTIKVGSDKVSPERAFLQGFKRKYDEQLIPAYRIVEDTYKSIGRRRQESRNADLDIELNRFFGWTRLVHAPGESWSESPIRDGRNLTDNVKKYAELWLAGTGFIQNEMATATQELDNIDRIRTNLASPDSIRALAYDDLFETLTGCHAFLELLRFTKGGLAGLKQDFLNRNSIDRMKESLVYLLHGDRDIFERAYDLIYSDKHRLARFGESCVMELVGWMDPVRPPFNGRVEKCLRFLGFDIDV